MDNRGPVWVTHGSRFALRAPATLGAAPEQMRGETRLIMYGRDIIESVIIDSGESGNK